MTKEKNILLTSKTNEEWVEEKKKLLARFEIERGLFVATLEAKNEENRTLDITLTNLNTDRKEDQKKIQELEGDIERFKKNSKDTGQDKKEDIGLSEKQKEQYEDTIKQEKAEKTKVEQEKKGLIAKNSEWESNFKEKEKELTKTLEQLTLKEDENKKLNDQIDQWKGGEVVPVSPITVDKEKDQLKQTIKEKDDKITSLVNELTVTRNSCIYLNGLLETIEGKKKSKIKWSSNRDTFIDIVTKTLPADRIKEELGDITQGWIEDSVFEILTREDKGKIDAWDNLQKQGLPTNWQELIARGQANSGGNVPKPSPNDSSITKPPINQWEAYFPNKQPQDARQEYDKSLSDVSDLKGQVKNLNDKLTKIKEYENSSWESQS